VIVRGAISFVLVLLVGLSAIWYGTDGFRAFTAEGARRLAVTRNPPLLPPIELQDHRGELITLDSFKGKVILLEFIYTRCPTLCVALGTSFERLHASIRRSELREQAVLVSLSFDPERDGPADLADYASRFGGADETWHFVRPRSVGQLETFLRAVGVIVLPDGAGGFVHNAAIHVIDREGRLCGIVGTDAVNEAIVLARRTLRGQG
jgi:protein SCO1/2